MKNLFITVFILIAHITSIGAQKQITVEDIWEKYTFRTNANGGFSYLSDGKSYSEMDDKGLHIFDLASGKQISTLVDFSTLANVEGLKDGVESYTITDDMSKVLLESGSEQIYRHSTKANVYIYDTKLKTTTPVYTFGKISNASLSPDGKKIAFVHNNNLYVKNLENNKITQVTLDGKTNSIINGMCDWVYEEEFSFTKAYEWSADGQKLGFLKFDESSVPQYIMPMYEDGAHPRYEMFKYPKVGDKNAVVTLHIVDVSKGKPEAVKLDITANDYIPRIKWTQDKNTLSVTTLNRHQNHLKLLLVDAKSKKAKILLEETNKYYIDITDNYKFLKDGKRLLWTSEKDGFNSVYLYDLKGKELKNITGSKYDILTLYGMDEDKDKIYFKAAIDSPIDQQLYTIDSDGKNLKKLSEGKGVHDAEFSPTMAYYTLNSSTINTANTYAIHNNQGKEIRGLESNNHVAVLQKQYGTQPIEFFTFNTSENVKLHGWMLKPADMKANTKYPVLMYQYSGPGSQEVTDAWMGWNYWWFQQLAQKGYIVACVDGRGTGARGEEFKKMTYLQLGKYEVMDQIETAKYLGNLPYIDKSRIGIFGWSYGGYMSTLAILKGNDYFKSAIAVAPVTNWKWYDSIYTERYMRTTEENPAGYKDNSPVYFAERLKGNYLLIHGMGDDNVHFQHAAEMANALITANKQYDTYFYPNKNHGIYGGKTRSHLYTKMTNFLLEKL
jgi:dipeptidyl-peptidase 4